ncbi:MAG: alpha/beta hydrolase family protein [Acidimicrobiales bacterium]
MPDQLVASAVAHWGPRFVSQGVDASDFAAITSRIDRWDQWCPAWCEAGAGHEELGREALASGRERSAGAHLARAALYYHFAKVLFVDDLAAMEAAHRRALRCAGDALPFLDPPGERVAIPYDGTALAGVLRRPRRSPPHPLVVLIPGLDSAKEELGSTEQLFLDRGLATLSVDGPGQGEAEYELAIRGDWEVPGAAVVDHAVTLGGIDPARIGVWGVSLGGYYAPRVASGEPRVRACIALAGPYDFGQTWDGLPELTRRAFQVRSKSPDQEVARERAGELSLAGRAGRITCPLLVVMGRQDRLIPWEHASRLAGEAGARAELLLLDGGNHVCTNVPYRHRLLAADWMAESLKVPNPRPTP